MRLVCLTLPVCPGCTVQKAEIAKFRAKYPKQQVDILDATTDAEGQMLARVCEVSSAPFMVVLEGDRVVYGLPGPLSVSKLEAMISTAGGKLA